MASKAKRASRCGIIATGLLIAGCATFSPQLSSPVSTTTTAVASNASNTSRCIPSPLGKRSLFLRGSFNHWRAADEHQLRYVCNRYELALPLVGEHSFKIGDEDWSGDADFGGTPAQLFARGPALTHQFSGIQRITFVMTSSDPTLHIESCPAAPFGETTLFLRGGMNNWAAQDLYAFQYQCDGYYLNVDLASRHEFKIADSAWHPATTFGSDSSGQIVTVLSDPAGNNLGNIKRWFEGEHTLRLTFVDGVPNLHIGPKTFVDKQVQSVSDPIALSARFDSRSSDDKQPFGAVTAGTAVRFAFSAQPGIRQATLVVEKRRMEGNQEVLEYLPIARIPMQRKASGKDERWQAEYRFGEPAIYGYYFELDIGGKPFIFQNNKNPVPWTREVGSMGAGQIDDMPDSGKRIRRYRQTVYAADFTVPDWLRDTVYYYIFPDRFRNGDSSNDPKPGISRYHDKSVEIHRNWLDRPWRPGSGDGSDNLYSNDFFGGDLAGIIEKLDYIKALGANAIYMTPIFKAASNHKYDTANYKEIDPAFGTGADFDRLVSASGKRGIRLILDTSLNHTGSDSQYFDRYGNHNSSGAFEGGRVRPDSPYASWYSFDPAQTHPDKQYKGWVGIPDLPELDKNSASFRRYAYAAPDSVMKLWLDRGAAGWRMDVAPWVPDDFWREWRAAIKQHKPHALTIAETWFDASKYFLGDMFDSTMNYIFRATVLDYAAGGNARELYQNIELLREAYPPQAFFGLMNLLSTHDQSRALHYLGFSETTADPEAIRLAKQRLRLAVFFQMTFPGAPTVYYGDETGMTGGDDPYNRATYPWKDMGGRPDENLLEDFRKLIQLRRDHAILRQGTISAPVYLDDSVIILLRELEGRLAITATSNALETRVVLVPLPSLGRRSFTDVSSNNVVFMKDGHIEITVPPLAGVTLIEH